MKGHIRVLVLAGILAAGLVLVAGAVAIASDFENPASHVTDQQFSYGSVQRSDTPNDPSYDQSEPDTQQPPGNRSTNFFDERFDLFGFPSQLTPGAVYRDGPNQTRPMVAGFNAAGAWKLERGRPDVTVAILDTGIRWDRLGLRRQIHLNTGELPFPLHDRTTSLEPGKTCSSYHANAYDADGNGSVDVVDYACDSRVSLSYAGRAGPNGLITGQDLIHAFGHCQIDASSHQVVSQPGAASGAPGCPDSQQVDNDSNGYANDIAGWNFFDNNNDPTDRSSYFAASNHGSGRASDAVEQGNDGEGSIGTCPHCQFMPIRVWDTFVSDGNTFGLAMTYATDNGVSVIEGADGSLYHSAFAEQASQYAYDHGVVQTYSGDDLNTGNHNYPANYGHAMLIEGAVPDTEGLGQDPNGAAAFRQGICGVPGQPTCPLGTNVPVQTFFRGANTTQYGGKSSISMMGDTGSANTGKASGAAALVVSAARDQGIALTPDETREILEQTAERVTTANTAGTGTPDPGADPTAPSDQQWTTHFGWGRVNLGAAIALAASRQVPPIAAINSPDWYAPLTGPSLNVAGRAQARFAPNGGFHWKLMWAPGLAPLKTSWQVAGEGDGSGTLSSFGSIDLNAVRSALATSPVPPDSGGPAFPANANPYQQQFTVQLEVSSPGIPTTGIDRRVFTAFTDPTLRPGYPKRLGTGGEAPVRYADINGDNVPELIVPTEDGLVHAYEKDGSELPGWPVQTQTQAAAGGHQSSPALAAIGAPREPPRAPVIADLDGTGHPDVITAAGIHIYAWHADGSPVAGFPVTSNSAFCGPAQESQSLHHPKCGFLASPAVGHLEGPSQPLDIVEPSLDGHLYAFRRDGSTLPGFPVALVDPAQVHAGTQMVAESINDPAVGDLNGDGKDDVVVGTNEVYGAPAGGTDVSFNGILAGAAGASTRSYAVDGSNGHFLPGWPITLPGIIQNVLPFVGPGHDAALAKINGSQQVITSATGGSLDEYGTDGSHTRTIQQNAYGPGSNATDRSGSLNLFESAAVGDVLGTGTPAVVKYQVTLNQAANLLLVGQNAPYNHLMGAFDATTGAPLPAFPTVTDDYQFLSSSTIAKVNATGPSNQVITGTGLGLLHAYDGVSGLDASGFPKQTGGWLFSPASISNDGRIADITREGYLFEWNLDPSAPACQPEWPSFRHDPHDSGNYNHDGTPPAAPAALTLTAKGQNTFTVSFKSPGDNDFCGTADHYVARVDGQATNVGLTAPVSGGGTYSHDITLPAGAQVLSVQAQDGAGNLGAPTSVAVPGSAAAGAGTGTGATGASGAAGATTVGTPGSAPGAGSLLGPGGLLGQAPATAQRPARRPSARTRHCQARPFAHLARRGVRISRSGLTLHGSARDGGCSKPTRTRISSVRVSVAQLVAGRCRFVSARGQLGAPQSCGRPRYVRARGTARWSVSLRAPLPAGRYRILLSAADIRGRVESPRRSPVVTVALP